MLNGLASPDEAIFYTSGKTSNEAAFAYQLFARAFGTNNLPDCSNMCHESTSVGAGRGDRHRQGLGEPRRHPRREADRDRRARTPAPTTPGCSARSRSPSRTARRSSRSTRCARPGWSASRTRRRSRGLAGPGTALADLHLPVRINGDLALFQAIGSLLLEWDALDHDFIAAAHARASRSGPRTCASSTGTPYAARPVSTATEIEAAARMFQESDATVVCWAMGITQHRNAVATVKEIVNVALLQGNIGKPGAGLCPVRGHSNVQGDRTMGIWERVPDHFLDALQRRSSASSRRASTASTPSQAIEALRDGKAKVFVGMGGNFVSAAPDTEVTEQAMRNADLTVHVSTKLNRSHVVTGREALILPALGRSEKDLTGGGIQRVTVEDSMSAVHASHGPAQAGLAAPEVRGRHHLLAGEATLGRPARPSRGRTSAPTTPRSGTGSPGWCRAARRTTRRSTSPAGSCCRTRRATRRTFPTDGGKAMFTASPVDGAARPRGPAAAADAALARPVQHHDLRPRRPLPRGIKGGRRVVFVHPDDIAALGLEDGGSSTWSASGRTAPTRTAPQFRVVPYDQPRGCAAAYYPETNPLVAAGLDGRGQQLAGVEVGDRAARAGPVAAATASRQASDAGRVVFSGRGDEQADGRARAAELTTAARWADEQPRGAPRRGRLQRDARCRGRDHDAARRAARGSARDARPPYSPAAASAR